MRREDAVVLVHQGPPGAEFWALPGGVVDDGELVPEALVREVREETVSRSPVPSASRSSVRWTSAGSSR
jgi:ADP-ribose pyrophosphatase YjhB (NUDIX family)